MADEKIHGIPFDAQEILTPTGELTYDHIYFASDLAKWLGTYFSNGVLVPGGAAISTELQVTKTSADSITVHTGAMVINGRTFYLDAPETFILNGTTAGNTRIDRVIVELNLTDSINSFRLLISTGVEGTAPSPQELVRDESVLKTYQMSLAQVNINPDGVVNIVDERSNLDVCGVSQVLIGVRDPLPVYGDSAANISYDDSITGLGNASSVQLVLEKVVSKLDAKGNIVGMEIINPTMSGWSLYDVYTGFQVYMSSYRRVGITEDMNAEVYFTPEAIEEGFLKSYGRISLGQVMVFASQKSTVSKLVEKIVLTKVL